MMVMVKIYGRNYGDCDGENKKNTTSNEQVKDGDGDGDDADADAGDGDGRDGR